MKRASSLAGFLRFALPLIAFLSLYTRYKEPADIESVLAANLGQPIAVYYGEARLALRPQEVDFQIDTAAMLAEAQQYLEGPEFVE